MRELKKHLVFPTLILEVKGFPRHEEMKEAVFKNHEYHNKMIEGYQGYYGVDGYGMVHSHHDENLQPLYFHIIGCVKEYVAAMGTDPGLFNYSIVKSWCNALDYTKGLEVHHHQEAHISFVYYLNCVDENQRIVFHDNRERWEPFKGWRETKYDKTTYENYQAHFWSFEAEEQKCLVYPSNMYHGVEWCDPEKEKLRQSSRPSA